MMEEIALDKEEEAAKAAKANFSEKNNFCDELLEIVDRDKDSLVHDIKTDLEPDPKNEGTEIEEIPFQTNSADPEILNDVNVSKANDLNIASEVHKSNSSETTNSELLESSIVRLKVLENQNTELICASEDQKKVIEMWRIDVTRKDEELLAAENQLKS